jgi:uncharacterized Zn finger protein (UPF0148 family)
MEIRGQRECRACEERWSYYETGSVTCPSCGSVRSVGVDDRTRHTDGSVQLDLSTAQAAAANDEMAAATKAARTACGKYLRIRGFVDAGRLRPLDEVFVAAAELRRAASVYDRRLTPDDDDRSYFMALLQGAAEGDRPESSAVPTTMWSARGLGMSSAVEAYMRDLSTWRLDQEDQPGLDTMMGRLRDHVRRIQALDGEVDPQHTDRLLRATQAIGRYAVDGVVDDRETARAALDGLV